MNSRKKLHGDDDDDDVCLALCVEGNFGHAIWHDSLQFGHLNKVQTSLCPIVTNYCSTFDIRIQVHHQFLPSMQTFPGKFSYTRPHTHFRRGSLCVLVHMDGSESGGGRDQYVLEHCVEIMEYLIKNVQIISIFL